MLEFFAAHGSIPANFLLGTSCIASTARACGLAKIKDRFPEARIWVSGEPLWKNLDFRPWLELLAWLVIGGESGHKARVFGLEWAYANVGRCAEARVPLFIKQLGSSPYEGGREERLKDKHGGDWSEWPKGLRVREPPKPPAARLAGQGELELRP
jgi:protein gp37